MAWPKGWELVIDVDTPQVRNLVYRLRVPGGWLFKDATLIKGLMTVPQISTLFVPLLPDPQFSDPPSG